MVYIFSVIIENLKIYSSEQKWNFACASSGRLRLYSQTLDKARNIHGNTSQVLHTRVGSWPFPQTLHKAWKGQTMLLITNINYNCKKFHNIGPCGLYYKHMTIVNDDSSIISKWSSNRIGNARVVIYNCNMFIIQANGCKTIFLAKPV
jgi:hypothetical protein